MRHVIALSVDDTGTRAALVGLDGTPLYEERRALPPAAGPKSVEASVVRAAAELRALGRKRFGTVAKAAGVAVPCSEAAVRDMVVCPLSAVRDTAARDTADRTDAAARDPADRTVAAPPGAAVRGVGSGRGGSALRERLLRVLGPVPLVLVPGVRAAALAEGRAGAARGADLFLYVHLGSRVAGAIGTGHGVETGAHGRAGELGHLVVRPGGPACDCGRRGCLDTVASAASVGRAWAEASGRTGADAGSCVRAVRSGDTAAAVVWRDAVEALADGLITAHTVLDVRTLVVGGGLGAAGDTLLAPLRAAVRERIAFRRLPGIVPAALGDGAGCRGAGLLALDLLAPARGGRPA
ncbi:ROK family protein [Streptomyces sp. NPDC057494]|uniref:ROK family protein n=1 Tax=Streptomyces sp. NPDC057494 TaxID=3346148 RepID=UPI0036BC65A4